ncbi:MAG: GntR family transcriptional regulator [Bacteroidales bacterium]|jgi:GntR family transcriptional regulator/GntR family frlABCD operon transcriptional regulator|nr:GntR family transcriptional regulator [Bacteroidales bacterium]
MGNIPYYKQIYELLRRQILDEEFTEGDLLPSENELCTRHGVTRPTIRHALDALVNDGLIVKHKGKGSIVRRNPNVVGILSLSGITSALGKHNLQTEIIARPLHMAHWPEPFPFHLSDAEIDAGCICMERLRKVTDKAIFYERTYLPASYFPRFTQRNMENRSLFEVLRKGYHVEIKAGEQLIRSIPADENISRYFKVLQGHPVLYLERKFVITFPDVYIYSLLYCNTEEFALYGTF